MKKNILAENMMRFNVKNLSEQTKKEILRLIEQDQNGRMQSFGATPVDTIRYAGSDWAIYSNNAKGQFGRVNGSIRPSVTQSNGEYVVIVDIAFPIGPKQVYYRGELMKTSKSVDGPDSIGTWVWRTPFKKNNPSADTSKSYFQQSNGTQKVQVDAFFKQLSNNVNAANFMKDVVNPLMGIK